MDLLTNIANISQIISLIVSLIALYQVSQINNKISINEAGRDLINQKAKARNRSTAQNSLGNISN